MDDIQIRKARPGDAPRIAEFNAAMALETENKRLDMEKATRGARAVIDDPARGFYLLAEVDGEVAGQLMVTQEWSDWRDADFWWLQSVYVRPGYRLRGVFRALWLEMERLARASDRVCGIRLYTSKNNFNAHRTYTALGMAESRYLVFEKML